MELIACGELFLGKTFISMLYLITTKVLTRGESNILLVAKWTNESRGKTVTGGFCNPLFAINVLIRLMVL